MTLEEKAEEYTTNVVLNGRASIEAVTEAYKAGYNQAKEEEITKAFDNGAEAIVYLQNMNKMQISIEKKYKEQIEKMKCCGNCENQSFCESNDLIMKTCDEWELAE